ncbi:unnamed protein product [Brachionus calyciflorus]|uniref:Uncharacterized protein n=1 Tax=Brachionus calyciflorus TaxID=104777 RepID=A0A814IQF7_9BILA|nr:unnamed protein product [Brachionus calyciflorus]
MSSKSGVSKKLIKPKVYALVQYLTDKTHAVIDISEVFIENNEELELNAIYDVNWKGVRLQAEVKYVGDKPKCTSFLDNISHELNTKKNLVKKATPLEKTKKNKQSMLNKNNVIESSESDHEIEENTKKKFSKNNNSDNASSQILASNLPSTSKSTTKKDLINQKSNTTQTFEQQLEERNKMIENLKRDNEELKNENHRLIEQLKICQFLTDSELRKNVIKTSFQCIKNFASNSEREELRRLCEDSHNVTLLSKYPNVILTNVQLQHLLMSISVKKSSKVIFKELLTALIPDLTIWGSKNAETMRKDYGNIIEAAREFLITKDIVLNKADFLLSTREMCSKGKKFMKENGLAIQNIPESEALTSVNLSNDSNDKSDQSDSDENVSE